LEETARPYKFAPDEQTCGHAAVPNNVAGYGILDVFVAVERVLNE